MKKDTEQTRVMFYIDENSPQENEVIAIFTEELYNIRLYGNSLLNCYAHIGQHSSAHKDYISTLKLASKEEYTELFNELESIGYNLRILNPSNLRRAV